MLVCLLRLSAIPALSSSEQRAAWLWSSSISGQTTVIHNSAAEETHSLVRSSQPLRQVLESALCRLGPGCRSAPPLPSPPLGLLTEVIDNSELIQGWDMTHLRVLGARTGDNYIPWSVWAALSGGAWSWANLGLKVSSENSCLCELG